MACIAAVQWGAAPSWRVAAWKVLERRSFDALEAGMESCWKNDHLDQQLMPGSFQGFVYIRYHLVLCTGTGGEGIIFVLKGRRVFDATHGCGATFAF